MKKTPYVPFYTSDFLAGTSGMTAATKGVYITLISLMYEEEAPLSQKWDTLARRCGCTLSSFKRAVETLADDGKLTLTDGALWSEKCDKHITQRRERSATAKAAAKNRWEKSQKKQGVDDANAMQTQCYSEPEPEPEPEPYKIDSPIEPPAVDEVAEAVRAYNSLAERVGWPQCKTVSQARRSAISARLKERGLDGWSAVLSKAEASAFLTGENDRGWLPNFDWFVKPQNLNRVDEGVYDNRAPKSKAADPDIERWRKMGRG